MVYLGTPWADAGAIAIQMRKANFKPVLMGSSILRTEKIIEMAGPAVEGMKAITNVTSTVFLDDYRERWNKEPHSDHCGLAYDALTLLADAIERAGFDRSEIRDALAETEGFQGVTGVFSFDVNRNPIKTVTRIEVKDGKWVDAAK
jgi:branched-chain amino acid transport system substrate-binding protein